LRSDISSLETSSKELSNNLFRWKTFVNNIFSDQKYFYQQYPILFPIRKNSSSLESKQKFMWLPQSLMFNAFPKHDRSIYDDDDDLDILWILLQWIVLSNQVGFAFNKQASTATASADEFDAFLSLSELFSSLSQLFLKQCDDANSVRVIENLFIPSLDYFTTIASNPVAISHVASLVCYRSPVCYRCR
jgi:hypothetical protein